VIQYVLVTSSYFYNHRSSSSALFSDTIHGDVLHIAVKSTLHSKLALEFLGGVKVHIFVTCLSQVARLYNYN